MEARKEQLKSQLLSLAAVKPEDVDPATYSLPAVSTAENKD